MLYIVLAVGLYAPDAFCAATPPRPMPILQSLYGAIYLAVPYD